MRYGLDDNRYTQQGRKNFPVQSSVLDEVALLSLVAKEYSVPKPCSCHFLSRGDADIYRVKTADHNFYLKIYRPPHSIVLAEAEAVLIRSLAGAGIPVVKPVLKTDQRFACHVPAPEGSRPMLLFEEAPPPLPSELTERLLSQIGETIAALHVAADASGTDFGIPEIDLSKFLQDSILFTSRFLPNEETDYLRVVTTRLVDILKRLSRRLPDFGLCHADLVLSNVRLNAEGTITLFDFGNVMKTWRVFDLAVFYRSLGNRYLESREILWQAFLKGYETNRPLPHEISDLLPNMWVLRQIGFLAGNCATLPLRLGSEIFEAGFMEKEMARLRQFVDTSHLLKE